MAYGGQAPLFQTQSQDLFSATDLFCEAEDQGADSPLRAYGSTGGSAPMQRPKLEPDSDEIPLHDFQVRMILCHSSIHAQLHLTSPIAERLSVKNNNI